MIIDVKVDAGAYVPTKAHEHDAGYDLYAIWPEVVPAHYSRTFDTGVHFAIPKGVCGLLVSKSGLNVNCGVTSTGLIDSGYTGSIKVKLYNHSDSDYHVQAGEKISQIVFLPCLDFETNLVMALANTDRGDAGFGSSGKIHPVAAGKLCGETTEVYKYDYTKYQAKPTTNGDRIRAMTDEELALQLYLLRLDALRLEGYEGFIETKDEVLDWLKQEVDGATN